MRWSGPCSNVRCYQVTWIHADSQLHTSNSLKAIYKWDSSVSTCHHLIGTLSLYIVLDDIINKNCIALWSHFITTIITAKDIFHYLVDAILSFFFEFTSLTSSIIWMFSSYLEYPSVLLFPYLLKILKDVNVVSK